MAADPSSCSTTGKREIRVAGTAVRLIVGGIFVGSVVAGHMRAFHPLPWIVGLVVFPGLALGLQRLRVRYKPGRPHATGPVAQLLNIAVFFALYLTFFYAPVLNFTSDAALLFYGTSMLLAAARGYGGCEVLAISKWVLGRNDQIGCLLFGPSTLSKPADTETGRAPRKASHEKCHPAVKGRRPPYAKAEPIAIP